MVKRKMEIKTDIKKSDINRLVNEMQNFEKTSIYINKEDNSDYCYNAKSLLSVLSMGLKPGNKITIVVIDEHEDDINAEKVIKIFSKILERK